MKLLCLGDSYTIGEGVTEEETWPHQLQRAWNERGVSVQAPLVIARTGWTGVELEKALEDASLTEHFDLVTLLIGVNDQYRGYTVESFLPSYERLLHRAVQFARGDHDRVMAISIPDWGVTPFAKDRDHKQIAREIDAFNRSDAQMCKAWQIKWIDITPLTRQLSVQPEMLVADQLHPSGQQYTKWVHEKILNPVGRQLELGRSK